MNRILITGANSFVGKNFIKYSKNKIVDEISLFENQPEQIDFNNYNVVLHLVAIVHQSKKISLKEYLRVNRDLCVRTAKAAKNAGVKQFIYLSTVKVYGEYKKDLGIWNEFSECNPDDPYGISKYQAELELKKLEDKDFTVSIIRTPLVYGENVRANMLSIIKLVEKFPILPLGAINNSRSFTSVENLVAFIDQIIEKKISGIFIAKDDKPLSTTKLVEIIAENLDKKIILVKIPQFIIKFGLFIYPKIFDRLYGSFELENSTTLKLLDFTPPLSIEEGLSKMISTYKKKF